MLFVSRTELTPQHERIGLFFKQAVIHAILPRCTVALLYFLIFV